MNITVLDVTNNNKIKSINISRDTTTKDKLRQINIGKKEQLKYYFPEFGPYEGLCRFSGCDHVHEPDCAVKQAAEEGKIHEIRYNDYVAMYRELQEKRRY